MIKISRKFDNEEWFFTFLPTFYQYKNKITSLSEHVLVPGWWQRLFLIKKEGEGTIFQKKSRKLEMWARITIKASLCFISQEAEYFVFYLKNRTFQLPTRLLIYRPHVSFGCHMKTDRLHMAVTFSWETSDSTLSYSLSLSFQALIRWDNDVVHQSSLHLYYIKSTT